MQSSGTTYQPLSGILRYYIPTNLRSDAYSSIDSIVIELNVTTDWPLILMSSHDASNNRPRYHADAIQVRTTETFNNNYITNNATLDYYVIDGSISISMRRVNQQYPLLSAPESAVTPGGTWMSEIE